MKVISVIENEDVIKKILKHFGLWDLRARPPIKNTTARETIIDYSESQLLLSGDYLYYDEMFPGENSDFSVEALSSLFLKNKTDAKAVVCSTFFVTF